MRNAIAPKPPSFASLVQQFFTEYLVAQRAVSPRTVACYRDALMLFLDFASRKLGKAPTAMRLVDIQPDLILAFLDPSGAGAAQRGSQPQPAADRAARVPEVRGPARRGVAARRRAGAGGADEALRAADAGLPHARGDGGGAGATGPSWSSQRDHLLLAMLYNTGARVSEIIGVRVVDVVLDGAACVHLHGKGRKQRSVPLWKTTVLEIRAWLRLNPTLRGEAALLPNRDGHAMTRCNVAQRLDLAVARAATSQPSLAKKQVSPHTLRHTTAMHLLQSGVPFNVIALWLGHESTNTTHRYVEADLAMKEKALARLEAPQRVYTPPDCLLPDYQHMLKTLGVERAVLVQPSVYGTDNTAMLDAMRAAGPQFRGVAVVADDVAESEFNRLHEAGVRGVRVNIVDVKERKAGYAADRRPQAARAQGQAVRLAHGISDARRRVPRSRPDARRLSGRHGVRAPGLHEDRQRASRIPVFKALLRLMQSGRAWVKLTGPYRISTQPLPHADTNTYAHALIKAAPQQVIWGTDWPHVMVKGAMPNDGDLCDLLAAWIPDDATRRQVLVDNPARLYGF